MNNFMSRCHTAGKDVACSEHGLWSEFSFFLSNGLCFPAATESRPCLSCSPFSLSTSLAAQVPTIFAPATALLNIVALSLFSIDCRESAPIFIRVFLSFALPALKLQFQNDRRSTHANQCTWNARDGTPGIMAMAKKKDIKRKQTGVVDTTQAVSPGAQISSLW